MTDGTAAVSTPPQDTAGRALHDERLSVPWSWWPAVLLIVTFGIFEVGSGFTWQVIVPVACFMVGFFVVPLVVTGRARVLVRDGVLSAGGKQIPVMALTSVQPLDRAATRLRLGPQADPACVSVVRGWIGPSVMARLSNPHPVPYWLVSSRDAEHLAAAIRTAKAEQRASR